MCVGSHMTSIIYGWYSYVMIVLVIVEDISFGGSLYIVVHKIN
jgi:hypothetical protein